MRKALVLSVLGLVLLMSISMVSAKTIIAGKIYDSDFSNTVSGADVVIICNGTMKTTTSASDGAYSVEYNETGINKCDSGDVLNVDASHPSYGAGSQSGVIHDDMIMTWDVGIVNVPLVPEFGLVIGMLTILGAVGVFFVVRRE